MVESVLQLRNGTLFLGSHSVSAVHCLAHGWVFLKQKVMTGFINYALRWQIGGVGLFKIWFIDYRVVFEFIDSICLPKLFLVGLFHHRYGGVKGSEHWITIYLLRMSQFRSFFYLFLQFDPLNSSILSLFDPPSSICCLFLDFLLLFILFFFKL